MASPTLVVRSGVGAWASIKYLITRGLDIPVVVVPPLVVSSRHSESPVYNRFSQSPVPNRHTVSGVR